MIKPYLEDHPRNRGCGHHSDQPQKKNGKSPGDLRKLPSGYVKIAIENDHRKFVDFPINK
jgi:hypothetical protein